MVEANRNERGYWSIYLENGPHGCRGTRVWLSRSLVPGPRCPLEGQQIKVGRSKLSGAWENDCPQCGRSLKPAEGAPEGVFLHPESTTRELEFPIRSAVVRRTERGSLILIPGKGIVYFATIPSGFRGSATLDEIRGGEVIAAGKWYHSPQGSLGRTAWALVQAPPESSIEIIGSHTGRRIPKDREHVHLLLLPDGSRQEVLEPEIEAILESGLEEELNK